MILLFIMLACNVGLFLLWRHAVRQRDRNEDNYLDLLESAVDARMRMMKRWDRDVVLAGKVNQKLAIARACIKHEPKGELV